VVYTLLALAVVVAGGYWAGQLRSPSVTDISDRADTMISFDLPTSTGEKWSTQVVRNKVVLINFWATWCGPCKAIAPVIDEIAGEYNGKVKVGKVDVDQNQDTAMKYGVRSIPTLLIMKDGKVVNQIVGAVPKGNITTMLDEII